jgi:hypothetical protein
MNDKGLYMKIGIGASPTRTRLGTGRLDAAREEESYNDIRRRLGLTAEGVAFITGRPLRDCRAYGMMRPYGRKAPKDVVEKLRAMLREHEAEAVETAPAAQGGK